MDCNLMCEFCVIDLSLTLCSAKILHTIDECFTTYELVTQIMLLM